MVARTWILLAGMLACGPAAPRLASANEPIVHVQLSNFKFAPKSIRLQVDKPYILRLENVSSGGHSFSSPSFFGAGEVHAEDGPKISRGKVEVPAGQYVEVHVIPRRIGQYSVRCTHPLHGVFGMTGTITVE